MSGSDHRWMLKAGPLLAIPLLIPVSVAIGWFLGSWLDSKLGTKPWLAIILTFLGLAAGIYETAKTLIEAARSDDE